jgi:SAM-dependent methyltransferase
MTIHSAAATGFARAAAVYERGRPGYPQPVIDWLRKRLGLGPECTVVDLAAGTGKLTRPLAGTGAEVIAVEPVAEMRAAIGGDVEVVEGTAERIPLPDARANAVTVGQAFHWFDGDAALAEIHRVLAPGGALALIWNRRPVDHPVHAAIEELLAPHHRDAPAHGRDGWRPAFERTTLFERLEERTFDNAQELDGPALADRVGSTSFVAALPEAERRPLLTRVAAIAGDGTVVVPYVTEVYVTDRRD